MSSPIVRFLKTAKALIASPQSTKITVVIGNEAADLDSMVSAISYAFLKHKSKPDRSYIPVIHVPRKDFSIRTDCTFALSRAFPVAENGDVTSQLTFIDEIDLDSIPDLHLILTDHNRLAPSLSRFSHLVTGILDHHKDEGLHLDASPRIVEPVGSATSLVALEWRQSAQEVDNALATFMLSPILLDTINLEPKFGRSTQKDFEATDYLVSNIEAARLDRSSLLQALFDQLQNAKFDCSAQSNEDLLKKDYKEVLVPHPGSSENAATLKFGIASVTWTLDDWIGREGGTLDSILESMKSLSTQHHLDITLAMLAFNHPEPKGFKRELLVHVGDKLKERMPSFCEVFVKELEDGSSGLELVKAEVVGSDATKEGVVRYDQGNVNMSRKKLLPIVERIVRDFAGSKM